jgi:hypothetical protein
MRTHDIKRLTPAVAVLALLAAIMAAPALGQQSSRGGARREQIELGRGMSLVTPNCSRSPCGRTCSSTSPTAYR